MPLSDAFEKLGRAIFETPFGANRIAKDAPELAEIRLAVLDAAKANSHRAGGQNVFPYNEIRIRLLGIPEEQAPVFQSEFMENYLSHEVRTALKRSSFRFPADLTVELSPDARMPAAGEKWLAIETGMRSRSIPEPVPEPGNVPRLIVKTGSANHDSLCLEKPRTNIGRVAEVYTAGGPLRRNDLTFEEDNKVNRTVSREHAHVVRSTKNRECRIFNDRLYRGHENCGLWIVRDAMSQPVHRSSRGTLLKSGDEIHLGSAVVVFEE